MNCKKGYTLIELGIVLLIMGVLASLGVKGYSMVHRAKIVKKVNRILIFEDAFKNYEARYGLSTDMGSSGAGTLYYKVRDLVTVGLISQEHIDSLMLRPNATATSVVFHMCKTFQEGDLDNRSLGYVTAAGVPSPAGYNLGRSPSICLLIQADYRNTCYIEQILDDKNLLTGNGRIASNNDAVNDDFRSSSLGNNFTQCDRMSSLDSAYYEYFWFIR